MDLFRISSNVTMPAVFHNPMNAFLLKRLVYQTYFPSLQPRQKYSGYEQIYPLRERAQTDLKNMFGDVLQSYPLPVVEMVAQLSPK